jgi:hypothetical protein
MTHIPEELLRKIRQGARIDEEQFLEGIREVAALVRASSASEANIKRLQDPETLRLHMGELDANELLVAQAAVRFALAKTGQS